MSIITPVDKFLRGVLSARESFIDDLDEFPKFEQEVRDLSQCLAAELISLTLTEMDELIRSSGVRKCIYQVQRRDSRSLGPMSSFRTD